MRNTLIIFFIVLTLASCENNEYEKRITELCNMNERLAQENDMLKQELAILERRTADLIFSNVELAKRISVPIDSKSQGDGLVENSEEFWPFLEKFVSDESFQITRILFPVEFETIQLNENGDVDVPVNLVTLFIKAKDWKHDDLGYFSRNEGMQIYDNYEMKFRSTDERIIHFYGVETSVNTLYYFKVQYGEWFLFRKELLGI
ncbi:hypothetical protein [Aureibacter tunicatorum]|uniref:Uncharacterized protein n=1 Tax=Aureibacter tunicatorum TaxID=866807 RepID=A0AAE3XM89_9BACT|nr:hypothetical protein [Aureibacter tunicatorum]MDR6239537.1 hypothetical protein [Aureibacter tunicatorum]BDD04014.1 hypothetical protein AUTU_14970 [Aureibacter tunicatorum]